MQLYLLSGKRENMKEQIIHETPLTFKIAEFEGPLDLLLHLIRKNEMDIYDIPMSKITAQYIDYLHQMQTLRLDVAGEYLVMAATLINIKSRMLLPTEQTKLQDDVEEFGDPREDLVQQLILHQTFKLAAGQLRQCADERQKQYSREQDPMPADTQLGQLNKDSLSLNKLQKAFAKLLAKQKQLPELRRKVQPERFSIEDEMTNILNKLKHIEHPIMFNDLFSKDASIEKLVTTFLALLELMKRGSVFAFQEDICGQILMKRGESK